VVDSELLIQNDSNVMDQHEAEATPPGASHDWSNRFLIAGAVGILFLTLYPFEFLSHPKGIGNASPFLLGAGGKGGRAMDSFLNVLLFIPFGFGLAMKLRSRGKSWRSALLYTWLTGALLSYGIEFLQLYIPARDSGWEDVFTNSTGAAVGCAASFLLANWLFKALSGWETAVKSWLSPRRMAVILLMYFTAWFLVSIALEKETRFDDWSADCFLVVGNDTTGRHPWKGEVSQLEIWNHALPTDAAQNLTGGDDPASSDDPLVRFDFSVTPPRQDNARLVIPFSVPPDGARQPSEDWNPADRFSWGTSTAPVVDLVNSVKRTNQFSIRLVLRPAEGYDSSGRILSISQPSGLSDLYVRQENTNLVFWFRNALSVRRPTLGWSIPHLLAANRVRDILFSYDGNYIRFYLDGKELQKHSMGPGATLASLFWHAKQAELNGYRDFYYAAVFFPAGGLLGIALTRPAGRPFGLWALLVFTALLAPLLLERILMGVNGRGFSMTNLVLSVSMGVAGILWINADRWAGRRSARNLAFDA
jgi:VanZ like family